MTKQPQSEIATASSTPRDDPDNQDDLLKLLTQAQQDRDSEAQGISEQHSLCPRPSLHRLRHLREQVSGHGRPGNLLHKRRRGPLREKPPSS